MFAYFATGKFTFPLEWFLRDWAPQLSPQVQVVPYESLFDFRSLRGTAILGDWDRLDPKERTTYSRWFAERGRGRLLNPPGGIPEREALNARLREAGYCNFRVMPAQALPADLRFPVFLRARNDHRGSLTPLLHDQEALSDALEVVTQWTRATDLLVCEWLRCTAAFDSGLYCKFSAMRIDRQLIPRHVLFARHWQVKHPDTVDPELAAYEREWMETFPERDAVNHVFDLAGVDYGRIDYGFDADGRMQVFEINTNPMVMPKRDTVAPLRLDAQRASADRMIQAFQELAGESRERPVRQGFPRWARARLRGPVRPRNRA
jgi:hypothetical protein